MRFATFTANGQQHFGAIVEGGAISLTDDFPQYQTLKDVVESGSFPELETVAATKDITHPDGSFTFTYELARSLCLLGAATAGVPAIETIQADFRDSEGLKARAESVRRAGFRGMLAIHPAQVEVINEAFTPGEDEVAHAREVVELFEANPGAGTIGWKGGMLDRPHLSRARQLLSQVDWG